jgi:hypothetical protein
MTMRDTITKKEAVKFFMEKIEEEIKKHMESPEIVKALRELGKKVLVEMIPPCDGKRMLKILNQQK